LATGGHPDLWVGFLGRGLAALDSQGWEAVPDPPGMPDPLAYVFAETRDDGGSLWMGTTSGVAQWDGDRWRVFGQRQGLAGNWVDALCPTTAFGVPGLLAGGVGGLSLWQGGRWRPVRVPGLPIGEAQALLEVHHPGKSPDLWVGTSTLGLLRNSGGRWERIGKAQGLPAEDVFCLHATEEPGGSVWVGFRGGGLGRFHEGRWTFYGVKDGLPAASVYALADTRTPWGVRLWAATPGGGLGWLDVDRPGAAWHRLDRLAQPPFPADTLMGLAKDRAGQLYATSTQGVIRVMVPPGAEDRPADWRFETYTTGDGLPSNNCISGAVYADSEGRLWGGTVHGVALFDPKRETPPDPLPALVLEDL
jgi:ligand-binding sensor domain-containing protein